MTESKQPKKPAAASADRLAKPTKKAEVELSEAALDKASGGAANATLNFLKIK